MEHFFASLADSLHDFFTDTDFTNDAFTNIVTEQQPIEPPVLPPIESLAQPTPPFPTFGAVANDRYDGIISLTRETVTAMARAHTLSDDLARDTLDSSMRAAYEAAEAENRFGLTEALQDYFARIGFYTTDNATGMLDGYADSMVIYRGDEVVFDESGGWLIRGEEAPVPGERIQFVSADGGVVVQSAETFSMSDTVPMPAGAARVDSLVSAPASTRTPDGDFSSLNTFERAPVIARSPNFIPPPAPDGALMQRVLIEPTGTFAPSPSYSEVLAFEDCHDASRFLKTASAHDPAFFTTHYQEELGHKFVLGDSKVYWIGPDEKTDAYRMLGDHEVRRAWGLSRHAPIDRTFPFDTANGGVRTHLTDTDIAEWLTGSSNSPTPPRVQEPVAPTHVGFTDDGRVALESTQSVVDRTVYDVWFHETGLTRSEYARLLATSVPHEFYETGGLHEQVSMLKTLAATQGVPLDTDAATHVAAYLLQEDATTRDATTINDALARAAEAKVTRVHRAMLYPGVS